MKMRANRSGMSVASRVLLIAGIAAGTVWISAASGCAGKRRALRQREAELARARSDEKSLDLASLAEPRGSAREVLDSQDPSTWTTGGAGTGASSGRGGSIYDEAPVILDDASDVTASGNQNGAGGPVNRARRGGASVGATGSGEIVTASESRDGESRVNAAVQIEPTWDGAIDVSGITTNSSGPAPAAATRRTLATDLAKMLYTPPAPGSATLPAYRTGVELLAMDLIEPGSVEGEIAGYTGTLAPHEHATFATLRNLLGTIAGAGDSAGGGSSWEAGTINRALQTHLASTGTSEPILIQTAALCTSVDGYGRYTPYASTTFVNGRTTPAIVYLALDHVTQQERATSGAGKEWVIDLVQSATIYHDSDNLVVVNLGEQTVRDVARDRRRDFCIARRIDIPASLSLGRYNLKITVRDQASGATAEAMIPVQIVGDASLTTK